jgi:hypothetical protein
MRQVLQSRNRIHDEEDTMKKRVPGMARVAKIKESVRVRLMKVATAFLVPMLVELNIFKESVRGW